MDPALFDGVVLLPPEPPTLPNEKEGVPPEAPPKRPPEAGAVLVALLDGALDEPGFPKVKDIVTWVSGGWIASRVADL